MPLIEIEKHLHKKSKLRVKAIIDMATVFLKKQPRLTRWKSIEKESEANLR
jgi:hypothetical protein